MGDRIRFYLKRIGERLWIKPLMMCVLSITGVFLAKGADYTGIASVVPDISSGSIEVLLSSLATSMLVLATFAVGSMVSAYASASNTATPRCFSLIIADDVSQNALSAFIGAFIFSIVALVPLKNDFFDRGGRFALLVLTLAALTVVVLTFVYWVDSIARLGRLETAIDKVEAATAEVLRRCRLMPRLKGVAPRTGATSGLPVYGEAIGYVQRVDVAQLQELAEKWKVQIAVAALPGTFCVPENPLAYVATDSADQSAIEKSRIARAFLIDRDRTFDEDPRFGFVVLSEIAERALSPAVNDPGTAINVTDAYVRLFALWREPLTEDELRPPQYVRVGVPELSVKEFFDDAFTAIARGGAGSVEVVLRLVKVFQTLASMGDAEMREAALHHLRLAVARAEIALTLPEDLERVRDAAKFQE